VLADVASPEAQHLAMTSVEKYLVDPQAGLIQLLTPPLQHARPSAGYIQAYPPGVRENGGQYNHAGVWAAMAWGRLAHAVPHVGGAAEHVYRYLTYLSPAHRAAHPSRGAAYGLEPYVMAGDVYTQPPYVGRGGWSWYTGSASWMHRAIIESLMGLQVCGHTLTFTPCLPSHWPQATLTLRRAGRTMRFVLIRASGLAALQPDEADWVAEWASAGSPKLAVGQPLDWTTLPETGTVVLTLAD
jgi:cyclic beta-1,2-glucan synthetase